MTDPTQVPHESTITSPQPKRPWHQPLIEETDYTSTEAGGAPTVIYDGPATYSIT
jgi:hypothetical protein